MEGVTEEQSPLISLEDFKRSPEKYTVVDIRNESEVKGCKFFDKAVNIPYRSFGSAWKRFLQTRPW